MLFFVCVLVCVLVLGTPGHYCPDGHNTHPSVSPLPCPGGTYNPHEGAGLEVDCIPCPAGRSCPGTGRNDTLACEEGHYCPRGTVQSSQYPCPPGTFTGSSALGAAEECTACPPGAYVRVCRCACVFFCVHVHVHVCVCGCGCVCRVVCTSAQLWLTP